MAQKYYLYFNITYQCNSHCIFCASDFTQNSNAPRITFKQFADILNKFPEGRNTFVAINGGEPALHPELIEFLKLLKRRKHLSYFFTNGRKFSSLTFAQRVFNDFEGTILVPFYTTKPETHDFFTRVKGSFKETMKGVENIYTLKTKSSGIFLQFKLLFAKPFLKENCEVANYVIDNFPETDILSLHSFIVSEKALQQKNLIPSKKELFRSVNNVLNIIKEAANRFDLNKVNISDLPICLLNDENKKLFLQKTNRSSGRYKSLYFDPFCLSEEESGSRSGDSLCATCERCRLKDKCRFL